MDNQGAVGGLRSIGHVQSSFRKRVPGFAKIFMLAQTVTIVSFSLWIYEEYLNNVYLRIYVSDFFQTEGWAIGLLAVAVGLGASTTLLFRRSKTMKKVEAVSTESKVSVPVVKAATDVSPKADAQLHPAVAALKAELAGRPVAFGTQPVSTMEEAKAVPAPKTEERNTRAVNRPSTRTYPIITGLRPQLPRAPLPPRPMPVLRSEDATPSAGTRPPAVPAVTTPQNVTTVITGLVPVLKKKDPRGGS